MEEAAGIISLIAILFIIFSVYFTFKILQFVVTATNLYKKMINRQDAMIKLLFDIRDNTKKYESLDAKGIDLIEDVDTFMCESCKTEVPSSAKVCPKCGAEFE